jgi:hypothetical protein
MGKKNRIASHQVNLNQRSHHQGLTLYGISQDMETSWDFLSWVTTQSHAMKFHGQRDMSMRTYRVGKRLDVENPSGNGKSSGNGWCSTSMYTFPLSNKDGEQMDIELWCFVWKWRIPKMATFMGIKNMNFPWEWHNGGGMKKQTHIFWSQFCHGNRFFYQQMLGGWAWVRPSPLRENLLKSIWSIIGRKNRICISNPEPDKEPNRNSIYISI